jgi:hypothetical protein
MSVDRFILQVQGWEELTEKARLAAAELGFSVSKW